MLDPNIIRSQPDLVRQNIKNRQLDENKYSVTEWLKLDQDRAAMQRQVEDLNKRKNELAELGKAKDADFAEIKRIGKELKDEGKDLEDKFAVINAEWAAILGSFPNIHMPDVPIGTSDKENVVVRKVGEPTKFDFEPKDHLTLGTELGILDFEAGSKVSGSQFYYLKGDAVRLELALLQFGLEIAAKHGFEPTMTPDLAKSRYYLGTGYAPRGEEAQIYEIKDEDLGLIATAEVTMAGMMADEILDPTQLPLKYAAISHCFRKEAGAYGKYSKGLYRVHQFTKLEMFIYCLPEQSEAMHQEILAIEEEILQKLEIPYQVLAMCTGDLGGMAAKKYDLEAWMPGRNDYGEVTSTSNCTDYQARNLNIKYKKETGENSYLHMLNGTALTTSRHPITILENYQQADGSIKVPTALVPYFGKDKIIKK